MRPDQPEADDVVARPGRDRPAAAGREGVDGGDAADRVGAADGRDRVRAADGAAGGAYDRGTVRSGPASRAEQLAEHARLRERVAASDQAEADQAAWADAAPGLRDAWEQHKQRYPERMRAAPGSEPDGSWGCGEHRRLDPEQNAEAGKAHADLADEAGRHILPALRRVEAADPERRLAGLEHMVKGEDRLKEKLADVLFVESQLTTRQALARVPDAVRFTLTYSADRYTEGVLADVARLKAAGFEEIKLKNLWDANQYKGINSQWRSSETGARFEMQFHTPESLEAKELTHEAYERLRRPEVETSQAERDDLEDFQCQVNKLVAGPPNVETIRDFPEKKR